MTNKQNNEPSVREAEELLKQMANIEPLTRQEVCDWYGFDLKDFPRLACANLEREVVNGLMYILSPAVSGGAIPKEPAAAPTLNDYSTYGVGMARSIPHTL